MGVRNFATHDLTVAGSRGPLCRMTLLPKLVALLAVTSLCLAAVGCASAPESGARGAPQTTSTHAGGVTTTVSPGSVGDDGGEVAEDEGNDPERIRACRVVPTKADGLLKVESRRLAVAVGPTMRVTVVEAKGRLLLSARVAIAPSAMEGAAPGALTFELADGTEVNVPQAGQTEEDVVLVRGRPAMVLTSVYVPTAEAEAKLRQPVKGIRWTSGTQKRTVDLDAERTSLLSAALRCFPDAHGTAPVVVETPTETSTGE